MTHKEESQLCHKIASLVTLLADYTHELMPETETAKQFKEKALELMPIVEIMLEAAFNVKEVRTSTYLQELSNKIDTVIRKNFTQII